MNSLKILIVGVPYTPIMEVGDKLSRFHELDFITLVDEPRADIDGYFSDKIDSIRLDTGDLSVGSEHQQWGRGFDTFKIQKEMDEIEVLGPGEGLSLEEKEELLLSERCIVSSMIPDVWLVDWADYVIFLNSDLSKMVEWLGGRRKCFSCGAVYHMVDFPCNNYPLCDRCGSRVKIQLKDLPDRVNKSYSLWKKSFHGIEKLMKEERGGNFLELDVNKFSNLKGIVDRVERFLRKELGTDSVRWTYVI